MSQEAKRLERIPFCVQHNLLLLYFRKDMGQDKRVCGSEKKSMTVLFFLQQGQLIWRPCDMNGITFLPYFSDTYSIVEHQAAFTLTVKLEEVDNLFRVFQVIEKIPFIP